MKKGVMANLEVRVILITYNGNKYIKDQLASILAQTHLESVRIYDDCSDNKFVKYLHELTQNNKTIEVNLNSKNLGVIANIKKALSENLDAKYIALSDQDDIWLPKKIGITLDRIKEIEIPNTPALVYHDMGIVDQENKRMRRTFGEIMRHNTFEHTFEANLITNLVTGSTSLMNNSLATYAKDIPEELNIYHDAWLGMVAYTMGRIDYIKQPLSLHRTHSGSLTFSEAKSPTILKRLMSNLRFASGLEKLFKDQFPFAEAFLEIYRNHLSKNHKEVFEKFLLLQNRGYLIQKKFIWNAQH